MKLIYLILTIGVIVGAILGLNYFEGNEENIDEETQKTQKNGSIPFINFTKSDYEDALNSDKLTVLFFYANWCPTCKKELADALYPAFNDLSSDNVVGIRVNYNDSETDDDERNLAREFGVAYQHTKVFLKNGERVLKSPESWDKERYLSEIKKFLN